MGLLINKAVYIENAWQDRKLCRLCKENKIYRTEKIHELSYPYYAILVKTDIGRFLLPVQNLEGNEDSVAAKGYIPVSLKQFTGYFNESMNEVDNEEVK